MEETANTADRGGPHPHPRGRCPTSVGTHLLHSAALLDSRRVFRSTVSPMSSRPGGKGLLDAAGGLHPLETLALPLLQTLVSRGTKSPPVENLRPKQTGKAVVSCGLSMGDLLSKQPADRTLGPAQHTPLPASLLPPSPVLTPAS